MSHPLEDCYDRLGRADEHLEAIHRELKGFMDREPYGVVVKGYPGSANKLHVVATARVREQTPRKVRVLLGEFFHNLRSSLDHLAYVLATPQSGGDPPPGTELKGQPVKGSGLYKMRGIPGGPQTVIKWLQPYRRINDPEGHPLWVIHDMNVGDKHRKAHVVGAILENQTFGIRTMHDVDLHIHHWGMSVRSGPFKNGATVGQFTATITGPNPEMDVSSDFGFDVAFGPKGPARGAPVMATLTELRDFVRGQVFPKLEKFVQ